MELYNFTKLKFQVIFYWTLNYNLEGNIDNKSIDKLTDNIFEYLKDIKKQDKDFQNFDFKNKEDLEPTIRMRYNPKTNSWEPVNFAEIKKWFDEEMRRASEKYNS